MAKPFRRKALNFFIKKELQGKLTWQFFLLTLIGLAIFSAIFSLLSADHLTIAYENQQVQISETPVILLKELANSNWIFLLTGGLFLVVAFIVMTHKIAGPIYRFEVVSREMCQRDLTHTIHLRKRDEAKDLANSLNHFNTQLSDDIRSLLSLNEQVDRALDNQDLQRAAQLNQEIQAILNSYQLKQNHPS